MAKDPAFLFYPGDWLSGTMYLTHEQKGAYMDLLILQFNVGKFTEAQAKQVLSICFDVAWPMLKQKFSTDGILYYNVRLQTEIDKRKNFTESRRNNAKGVKNKETESLEEEKPKKHMLQHMEDEDINKDVNKITPKKEGIDFEVFWVLYDKKVGSKEKLKNKWDGFSEQTRRLILDHIPLYKKAQPDKWYRKDPSTYFNNKTWLDEIIIKTETNGQQKNKPAIGAGNHSDGRSEGGLKL